MKILILGGSGMLGHQLWRHLHLRHDVWVTLRGDSAEFERLGLFADKRVINHVDAAEFNAIKRIIEDLKPDAVLNCIGLIKQSTEAKLPIPGIEINALLPHRLSEVCRATGSRLVLFSTDCVFSGRRGNYTEADISDAEDLYGRTKFLGEVADQPHVVTLRTSIIGRGLVRTLSLIDWFLAQKSGIVRGYRRAIYSGLTTIEMARVVDDVVLQDRGLSGLWQVASDPISKYDLLLMVREKFKLSTEIVPDDDIVCDRSLNYSRFQTVTGYNAPTWTQMIEELASYANTP